MQELSNDELDQCRAAMQAEQTKSLAETNHWAHVDRQQVHADWDVLYKTLSPLVDQADPDSPEVQGLIEQHYRIASRFYTPSRQAYIGMSLFYADNPDMRAFHNGYHTGMVAFLGRAIQAFAQRQL